MLLLLTNAKTNDQVLIFVGTGGVIKAEAFDDGTTELYNAEGNVVATVKEKPDQIKMNAGSGV